MRMACDGQPFPVDENGYGQVEFVAPSLRGAAQPMAVWEGSISYRYDGRNSTFRVRVPYTIVR